MNSVERVEAAPCERPSRWNCRSCGALLGVEQGGELHMKYKDVQHWITGRCRHACRRCGSMNTRHVGPPGGPPTTRDREGGGR
jgi:hypothetical protein